MEILRTGVILFTEKYEECVAFCRNAVGLRVLFTNDDLTAFDFGGSYLMVERGGSAEPAGKTKAHNSTCFRFLRSGWRPLGTARRADLCSAPRGRRGSKMMDR